MTIKQFQIKKRRAAKRTLNAAPQIAQVEDSNVEEQEMLKRVAFYSAAVTAWYGTAFEHDKSILTLSSAGIALLITLLTTVGAKTLFIAGSIFFSMFAFLLSVIAVLVVFRKNKEHLVKVIHDDAISDPLLVFFDKVAVYAFFVGILFAILVGIANISIHFQIKETNDMTSEKKKHPTLVNESFVGVSAIAPKVDIGSSVSGAGMLNPTKSIPQAIQEKIQAGTKTKAEPASKDSK